MKIFSRRKPGRYICTHKNFVKASISVQSIIYNFLIVAPLREVEGGVFLAYFGGRPCYASITYHLVSLLIGMSDVTSQLSMTRCGGIREKPLSNHITNMPYHLIVHLLRIVTMKAIQYAFVSIQFVLY